MLHLIRCNTPRGTQGVIIQPNTYTINVGKGGAENNNGNDSSAFGATCLGGGSTLHVAFDVPNAGRSGGSGSGGSSGYNQGTGASGGVGVSLKGTGLLSTGILYNGNVGGVGGSQNGNSPFIVCSGGGGGAGNAGKSTINNTRYNNASNYQAWITDGSPGAGGDGVFVNITGVNYYWGGGGGGGSLRTLSGTGGLGGGGAGSQFEGTTSRKRFAV